MRGLTFSVKLWPGSGFSGGSKYSVTPGPGTPREQTPHCRLGDMVYERAVCILLECNLVDQFKHAIEMYWYRLGTINSNAVISKFHLIRSYYEIFFYHFPNISYLKCTVNSNFRLIRSKTLLTNVFELTVPDLYMFLQSTKEDDNDTALVAHLAPVFWLRKINLLRRSRSIMTQ